MSPQNPSSPPRWSSPYVTAPQLVATGLVSRATLDRERQRGALMPIGRRGGRGPLVYRVDAVERWLAGDVPGVATTRPPPAVLRGRPADSGNAAALARLDEIARGGRR